MGPPYDNKATKSQVEAIFATFLRDCSSDFQDCNLVSEGGYCVVVSQLWRQGGTGGTSPLRHGGCGTGAAKLGTMALGWPLIGPRTRATVTNS
jgi:hypothetical protein